MTYSNMLYKNLTKEKTSGDHRIRIWSIEKLKSIAWTVLGWRWSIWDHEIERSNTTRSHVCMHSKRFWLEQAHKGHLLHWILDNKVMRNNRKKAKSKRKAYQWRILSTVILLFLIWHIYQKKIGVWVWTLDVAID